MNPSARKVTPVRRPDPAPRDLSGPLRARRGSRHALAASKSRTADARTLYLLPARTLHVSSTGEALVVSKEDGEVHRLPAARLLRVVCNERVHWSGPALGLCQQRGITVTWFRSDGRAIGHLYPAQAPRVELADAFDALTSLPCGWAETYGNWLRRQRLQVLQRWQAEREASGHPAGDEEAKCAKRQWVYRNEIAEHLPPILHGMISAMLAALLAEQGLALRYWCFDGQSIELGEDLARLVWAELNFCGGAIAEAMREGRETAALFERWSSRCADIAFGHLTSLRALAARELHASIR